jgi:hypothetical protein
MTVQSLDSILALRNGHAIHRRLRWLDDRLNWHGFFRRSDLADKFGISLQQASADIAAYQSLAPANLRMDNSRKVHLREAEFIPLFAKNPLLWMDRAAEDGDQSVIPRETLTTPSRRIEHSVVAFVFASYETRVPIRITYQSMTSKAPSERIVCPHHVVDVGTRIHLRAWDDRRRAFGDFVIGRIHRAVPAHDYPWVDSVADADWNETVDVILAPNENLSPSQRAAVEADYGMSHGTVKIQVRRAMVLYMLDSLGLLNSVRANPATPDPTRDVRCGNAGELRLLLPPADPTAVVPLGADGVTAEATPGFAHDS